MDQIITHSSDFGILGSDGDDFERELMVLIVINPLSTNKQITKLMSAKFKKCFAQAVSY